MSQVTIVGCDLHDRSMLLKFALDKDEPQQKSFHNDQAGREAMIQFLIQFARQRDSSRIVFVYEASGQGYGLHDLLADQGIECYVLSPTHLPKTAKGKRNKTDAKDAQMLFELARGFVLAGNQLPIVWPPPQALRDDRELVRARLETAEACTRIKLQVFSMLKRYGKPVPEWFRTSRVWSRRFVRWLKEELCLQLAEVVRPVLGALIGRFEILHQQLGELDRHLRRLANTERYRVACAQVRELPGVGLLTAMTFLTEVGDLTRFHNRRQVAAYLGLCPSSFESGEVDDRKGHITRQGPGRLRKVLCQAAWTAVRTDATMHATWERIRRGSSRRGKKAIVAVMRKLGIQMWHRGLSAGVATELLAAAPRLPCWIEGQEPPSAALSQAG
jgi:transposase